MDTKEKNSLQQKVYPERPGNKSFDTWDLSAAKELVFDKCGFDCTEFTAEAESAEYGAYTFRLNGVLVKFRVGKITPLKAGQFVTLWKRKQGGPIEPFDLSDDIAFFIISVRKGLHSGLFILNKSLLFEKGIISGKNLKGKRAIRLYPPWDKALNKQAQKTQQWQLKYFLDIPVGFSPDIHRATKLCEL